MSVPKKTKQGSVRKLKTAEIFVLGSIILCFISFVYICYDLPNLSSLTTATRKSSIIFEDCNGSVIATYGDLFGRVVDVEKLPKHVAQAVIAIEDRRFYSHFGVDLIGLARAIHANLSHKPIQGGSTITQQLAKNLFLTPNRSIKRKLQELILALMIEHRFTKNQILTIYLNRVYFGGGAYGLDAAAHRYFGKSAKDLDLLEAAKIAACLKSPTAYSPICSPDSSDKRAALVLSAMLDCGFVTREEVNDCIENSDTTYRVTEEMSDNRYFTDWVMELLPELCSSDEDLIVRTTLDRQAQKNAITVIRSALINEGFDLNASQMALISMDYTGAVRAMVGGHTYSQSQFNRCFASRSAGSSFKFFVFLNALKHGLSPNDLVNDTPIRIGSWRPKNYHWASIGQITLSEAFSHSVNSCSIRLARKFGINSIINTARELGFSSHIPNDFTMSIGSGAANIAELAAAYGAVLSNGIKVEPYGVLSIRTKSGKVVYRKKRNIKRVLSEDVCAKMKTLLKAVVNSGTGRRAQLPIQVYGKSGTSNNSMDACFVGFASPLVTAVWVGNDAMIPMSKKITGGTLPAKVWHDFMYSVFYKQDLSDRTPTIKVEKSASVKKKRKKTITNFVNQFVEN